MKSQLILVAFVMFLGNLCAQTISYKDRDGLKNIPINDADIAGKTFSLDFNPTIITVSAATAFTTKVNDGKKAALNGVPGNSRSGTAKGSIVVGSPVVNGTYTIGTAMQDANNIKIKVLFTSPGYYTINTNTTNGMQFFASGYAESAGQQDITLKTLGEPIKKGNIHYTISFGTSSPVVTVSVTGSDQVEAAGTLKLNGSDLDGPVPAGTLTVGTETNLSNTMKIKVTVTAAGRYAITTNTVNGVFFFASGNLVAGNQDVTLTAHGTPFIQGAKKYTVSFGNSADFSMSAVAAAPDIFTYTLGNDVTKLEMIDPATTNMYTIQINPGNANTGGEGGDVDEEGSAYLEFIKTKYGDENIKITPYGVIMNTKINGTPYLYGGPNCVHIFLDELGNSLMTTIPQGIPEMQYVVHIIYKKQNNGKNVAYGVKTTKGSFIGGNRIENSNTNGALNSSDDQTLTEYIIFLKTSDSEVDFDVYRYENGAQVKKVSYAITMTSTYTANISVGLLTTWLENPTYSLENDPNDASLKVVKETDAHNRGFATVFATLYTSPITLVKYYIDRKKIRKGSKDVTTIKDPVADFQLHSKDYLYMRPVWERIYPTIGVGLSDKVFQNLFFGLNWEIARGASFFAGGHYGKVNLFTYPDKFEFEKTNVTEDQFNLYRNSGWKINWAIGASVDFAIIGNLFK